MVRGRDSNVSNVCQSFKPKEKRSRVDILHIVQHTVLHLPQTLMSGTVKQVRIICPQISLRSPPNIQATTLQQAQTHALLTLLNLNQPVDSPTSPLTSNKPSSAFKTPPVIGPPVWKILVLDQQTKDVLATVLRVQDLRDVGVTLHV